MLQTPHHYESFRKNKSICEKVYEYCQPPKEVAQSPPTPPTPARLKRTRRIYRRREVSNPQGEISITIYKKKEHDE